MTRSPGFTLIEALIALLLALTLAALLAALIDSQNRLVRRQTQAADLQQSVRILGSELARMARMAGRGGLPAPIAVETRNNVAKGTRIGGANTSEVRSDSDVLVVRGVFAGPLAVLASAVEREPGTYELELRTPGPLGREQDLGAFEELAEEGSGEALILSTHTPAGIAIVELGGVDMEPASAGGPVAAVILTVRNLGSDLADAYRGLAGSVGEELDPTLAARVGVLEEYRFFVRVAPDPFGGEDRTRLARARFYPGTERVHPTSPGAADDLVDHALDLQVALGFDLDRDGHVFEGELASDRSLDEWLGNDPGDDPEAEPWLAAAPALVRVSGWLRSARAQVRYISPVRERLEDRLYRDSETPGASELLERRFLQLRFRRVVQLRNP